MQLMIPRTGRKTFRGCFALGILCDLPQKLAEDLSRFCRRRLFLSDAGTGINGYDARFRGELWSVSFTDDNLASSEAVDDFHRNFAAAHVVRSHLKPEDIGQQRVGHIGAFEQGSEVLWQKMAKWLQEGTRRTHP